jgi:hypothetical protein
VTSSAHFEALIIAIILLFDYMRGNDVVWQKTGGYDSSEAFITVRVNTFTTRCKAERNRSVFVPKV